MSEPSPADEGTTLAGMGTREGQYVVVARRYRPQNFAELIGQDQIGRALANAISSNRVGHAYLFTGARGVGKTSTARILAKALNCVTGPTPTPCNECDICRAISTGDDVDVLEIDGASNRGIDEIRELRQNVNVRPSRSRYKIYIIDEVHMLTAPAFNALLKTLEEPPEHVKFIFCTTEAEKIPITILSRCQRFDFAGIDTRSIAERLRQIAEAEGVAADPEALELLARRAAGSMRDSQSLLEQLLAFGGERITAADVHAMLGTAASHRIGSLATALVGRQPGEAIAQLDGALGEGVDVGQLLTQLLGFFRDALVAAVGAGPQAFLFTPQAEQEFVVSAGKALGVEAVLAAMQIIDHALARMRYSTQARILAELALVRIAALEDLSALGDLIAQLHNGTLESLPTARPATGIATGPVGSVEAKKKPEPALAPPPVTPQSPAETPKPAPAAAPAPLTSEAALAIWQQAIATLADSTTGELAKRFEGIAISAPNRLVVSFKPQYSFLCQRPETLARIEQAVSEAAGRPIQVEVRVVPEGPAPATPAGGPQRSGGSRERLLEKADHPLVRRAIEVFDARPARLDEPSR